MFKIDYLFFSVSIITNVFGDEAYDLSDLNVLGYPTITAHVLI